MKKLLLAFGLVLVFAVGVRAYAPLAGYLDWVQPVGAPVSLVPMRAAGWVFDCASGNIPGSGTGLLIVDGVAVPAYFSYGDYRPDVQAAFSGVCPRLSPFTGFHVDYYATPGDHVLDAMVSQGDGVYFIQQQPFTAR
jgi:hypothetical protein